MYYETINVLSTQHKWIKKRLAHLNCKKKHIIIAVYFFCKLGNNMSVISYACIGLWHACAVINSELKKQFKKHAEFKKHVQIFTRREAPSIVSERLCWWNMGNRGHPCFQAEPTTKVFVTWFAPVLVFIHFHLGIYLNHHTWNL